MVDKVYNIELDDYATPGFVTFGKDYYGTMADVTEFISKFTDDDRQDLIEAFKQYKLGNKDVEIVVGYWKNKFLKEVKVYGSKDMISGAYKWEHINIWGFPYYMKCDGLESKHYWIKNGNQLCRVIKAKFKNLQYESVRNKYVDINMIWGFPHIIEFGTYNTLMVVEKKFDTENELKEDMKNFSSISDMDFTSFCNDIFADG